MPRSAIARGAPVLGVDGARHGWVGVRWAGPGSALAVRFGPTLAELLDRCDPVEVVAIDMPIGLVDANVGRRPCDIEVRPLLGPRRSSLFSPPLADALDFETYADANAWSKRVAGIGLSKQAWMLVPRIREVRALAADRPGLALHETFPELSFAAMGDGPIFDPKRSWNGLAQRIELLAQHGLTLPTDAGVAGSAAADDIVDAAACAWSAARIRDGLGVCRPAATSARDNGGSPPDGRPTGVPHDTGPTIWW